MKKNFLEHAWLVEHAEWPAGVPRTVGAEANGKKLIYIAGRSEGIGLDIYYTEQRDDD